MNSYLFSSFLLPIFLIISTEGQTAFQETSGELFGNDGPVK